MPDTHSIFLDDINFKRYDIDTICRYHKFQRNKILTNMKERANILLTQLKEQKEF